ncbi:MAG TPA: protocatechuate 3,4-dioxygenase [Myxococcota bacterium]|nr:protocatechuate 3,4-dioxygenase [Myxococcota bacterium]
MSTTPEGMSRRDLCVGLLTLAGAGALGACRSGGAVTQGADDGEPPDSDDPVADTDPTTSDPTETGSADVAWATGGTASMTGEYADPFTDEAAACALLCPLTLGPCYAETVERKDISEGWTGLPARLALQVVDEACDPVAGATIDVWHTSFAGLYSGDDAAQMCTNGDTEARAHRFFRGAQTTDADGRVDFDTCFPGWYSSRTVHIHFTIRRDGQEYLTSQLFFPQELIRDVFANHPEYRGFGQPDTTNTSDTVLGDADAGPYTLSARRMADGALLAWKRLVIRSSLATSVCSAGGGAGGPPPR